MYSVSEEYKNALLEKVIEDRIKCTVRLCSGTELILSDSEIVSNSVKIVHELCGDYRVGTFNLGYLKIGFFDDEALMRDYSGAEITVTYEIKTGENWETVPMGIFIADGQTVKRRRNTVMLTAYDYGILFDCKLKDSVREAEDTAENLIKLACDHCGVEFSDIYSELPNRTVKVKPSSAQIQTYRDMIGWCATMLCGYGVIDRSGKLRIITSRHEFIGESDITEVDKYLTSGERHSIYATDNRPWISLLSAYSGGKRKIYKSPFTPEDSRNARGVYTLEKNPLLDGKSEEDCDKINTDWLRFIDSFMQRGITAELYGDPALDVGDMLRCSEGDIDQRRSILGMVTKQEWRYRNFHTVICACTQISDGFDEESGNDNETDGADNEKPKPVKVVSQLEKMLECSGSGGGVGIFVNPDKNAERFNDYANSDKPCGSFSHAEGDGTVASGHAAHAEGFGSEATGDFSHSEGAGVAGGNYSHAEGTGMATVHYAHAEGYDSEASGEWSHAENHGKAKGKGSHAENDGTAQGEYSHAEGSSSTAGNYSHAEGFGTSAEAQGDHAEGSGTVASGGASHAEGMSSKAVGFTSHAEGNTTEATGSNAHSEGGFTKATGFASHAEGQSTRASGDYSHAGGENTIASGSHQTAIGKYNEEKEDALFIVGNGSYSGRSNAMWLDGQGNLWIAGSLNSGGTEGGEAEGEDVTYGDGIKIEENVVSVNIGNGLEFEETEGAPDGETRRLVPKIDNETITLNDKGELEASGGIQYGIIIQEKDVEHLLHEYTEVGYIAGNKICYGGASNPVIVQGYRAFPEDTDPPGIYTDMVFSNLFTDSGKFWSEYSFRTVLSSVSGNYMKFDFYYDTNKYSASHYSGNAGSEGVGWLLKWEEIVPPGDEYPYGYIKFIANGCYRRSSSTWSVTGAVTGNIPFASEAEYNAAVGLTYEPVELTLVNESVSEVKI